MSKKIVIYVNEGVVTSVFAPSPEYVVVIVDANERLAQGRKPSQIQDEVTQAASLLYCVY